MLRFQGRVSPFFSFFFFFFLFFSFFFERLIGLLFKGLDLLKVVKGTRPDFCRAYEARQFFSLLMKSNVHGVWLVQSGRKKVEYNKNFNGLSTQLSITPF